MRPESQPNYRHYARVRIGTKDGPKGRLLRCESKRLKSGHYWKVKLDDGRWVPAVDVILDGPGEKVSTCAECGLRFISEAGGGLCGYCDNLIFGTQDQTREQETRDPVVARNWLRKRKRIHSLAPGDPAIGRVVDE